LLTIWATAVVVVAVTGFVLKDGARAFQASVAAQAPNPNAPANFITVRAPVVALTHARVIDGTGAPARADQTIVVRDGNIAELGDAATVAPPAGATVVDLSGKSVISGLVMMHEHSQEIRRRRSRIFAASRRFSKTVWDMTRKKLVGSVRGQVGIWYVG
jgi:hypothetical protein